MDRFLIEYLKSGRAWVLVGSGPSTEMGYPSWSKLAEVAISTVKAERAGHATASLDVAFRHQDFPGVFEQAQQILGAPRLLQALHAEMKPSRSADIYKLICRWPVSVYLTTNYDDELQTQLAELRETYIPYLNSEDHMAYLSTDLQGAIFKLHGDLRSEKGLILTKGQYDAISKSHTWDYWRTKMTSVFQMMPVIVIGHSLSDRNFQHVLEAAKKGAGVHRPVCWIAPDVDTQEARNYLEEYRIRVVSYDNRDGDHANLRRLIEHISDFVPPRTAVRIAEDSPRDTAEPNAAAAGFFVFNSLAARAEYEQKRIEILIAAIQAAIPNLAPHGTFDIGTALQLAGWPEDTPLAAAVEAEIGQAAVTQGLLARREGRYALTEHAQTLAGDNRRAFEHSRGRFLSAVTRRIRRDFPALDSERATALAHDIEGKLTVYFKEGGLTLASILFARDPGGQSHLVPISVLHFMNEASAAYGNLLERQAFITTSLGAFTQAGSAERDYLGRIAQGFFGFHALGAFGDVAVERLRQAKGTVWLLDSNVQISALAIGALMCDMWRESFRRLKKEQIRFFTTERLFDETREHWWFGDRMVQQHGPVSRQVIAAALGEPPFRRSNLFLQGFTRWQAAGNPADWESYSFQVFGARNPTPEDIKKRLGELGVEVVPLADWPGFSDTDLTERDEYTQQIAHLRRRRVREAESYDEERQRDHYKKALPEGEALHIVRRERHGKYFMLSDRGVGAPAWFISDTSILNLIENGVRITWQPEAFLKFATTLSGGEGSRAAERAFEILLWGLAQTGLSLLDEKTAAKVLGGVIDEATLSINAMRQMYEKTLADKYGEPLDAILARLHPIDKPLAALQLANEIRQVESARRERAETIAEEQRRRAKAAEQELQVLQRFRKKMEEKKELGRRKARKQKGKSQRKSR